jgi:hypothetical protein
VGEWVGGSGQRTAPAHAALAHAPEPAPALPLPPAPLPAAPPGTARAAAPPWLPCGRPGCPCPQLLSPPCCVHAAMTRRPPLAACPTVRHRPPVRRTAVFVASRSSRAPSHSRQAGRSGVVAWMGGTRAPPSAVQRVLFSRVCGERVARSGTTRCRHRPVYAAAHLRSGPARCRSLALAIGGCSFVAGHHHRRRRRVSGRWPRRHGRSWTPVAHGDATAAEQHGVADRRRRDDPSARVGSHGTAHPVSARAHAHPSDAPAQPVRVMMGMHTSGAGRPPQRRAAQSGGPTCAARAARRGACCAHPLTCLSSSCRSFVSRDVELRCWASRQPACVTRITKSSATLRSVVSTSGDSAACGHT